MRHRQQEAVRLPRPSVPSGRRRRRRRKTLLLSRKRPVFAIEDAQRPDYLFLPAGMPCLKTVDKD
jgi:hypothetical protein